MKTFRSDEERRLYNRQHARVNRNLGKAREYECEMQCGSSATEWAQTHGMDGSNDDHFRALCHKCHLKYDNRWNEAERKKVSETNKRLGRTPPSQLGAKRSEETLAKMSEAQLLRYQKERTCAS